jgi:hypothetical protein
MNTRPSMQLFLIRGLVAIAWAAAFAAVSDSLTTGVTVGAGILLVLYPLIDVAASLIDARSQNGSARRLLLAGAAVSAVAAVALGVAATRRTVTTPARSRATLPASSSRTTTAAWSVSCPLARSRTASSSRAQPMGTIRRPTPALVLL